MEPRRPAIDTLTAFRLFAALPVVATHFRMVGIPAGTEAAAPYIAFGSIAAMTFFFVLSGFILAYNYRAQFVTLDRVRVWNFWVLRYARLYPVHLLTFLMSLGCIGIAAHLRYEQPQTVWKAVFNLCLIQSWVPDARWCIWFNPVAWSLSAEAFFYFTLPFVLWLFTRVPGTRWQLPLAAAFWVAEVALAWEFCGLHESEWLFYACPGVRWLDFAIGVLLGLHFAVRPVPVPRSATLRESAAVLFLMTAFAVLPQLDIPRPVILQGYFTPGFAVLIYVFAFQGGRLSRWVSCRPLVYLGEASFSLYMLHIIVVTYFVADGAFPGPRSWPVGVQWLLLAAASVGASVLCFEFYETPLRRSIIGRLHVAPPAPAPTARQRAAA
jgi:peptidoglycan/LPS O-acetylase OafA/YrhL